MNLNHLNAAVKQATNFAKSYCHVEMSPFHIVAGMMVYSQPVKNLLISYGFDELVITMIGDQMINNAFDASLFPQSTQIGQPPISSFQLEQEISALTAAAASRSATEISTLEILNHFVCNIHEPVIHNVLLTGGNPSDEPITNTSGQTIADAISQKFADFVKVAATSASTTAAAAGKSKKPVPAAPGGMFPGFPEMGKEEPMTVDSAKEILATYGKEMTALCKSGAMQPIVIGRDKEIQSVIETLAKMRKRNAALIGEAGVGKSAIVEGIAAAIAAGSINPTLADHMVYSIDLNQIMAGAMMRGDVEKRVKQVMDALEFLNANGTKTIVFFDEFHVAMGQGETGSIANQIKQRIDRSGVKLIVGTTKAEFDKHVARDKAMARRLDVITVNEPDTATTMQIAQEVCSRSYEPFHKTTYTPEAIAFAVSVTTRFERNLAQPDKALSMLDSAGAYVHVNHLGVVDKDAVAIVASKRMNLDLTTISSSDRAILSTLEGSINSVVIGQETAVAKVVRAVITSTLGIRAERKTAGSFMLTGPTGVGKTELVKQLAAKLGRPLVRLDMSEYADSFTRSKLIGSSAGYVGFGDQAELDQIKAKPNAILLIDEIEKAHPTICDLFLQILDDASIKNSSGQVIDFQHCMVFFTSNVGGTAKGSIGFDAATVGVTANVQTELKKFFRPEMLNRFDAVIPMQHLTKDAILSIVQNEMMAVSKMLHEQGINIELADGVVECIANNGYNRESGARPIKRYINDQIVEEIGSQSVMTGAMNFVVKVENNKITISK